MAAQGTAEAYAGIGKASTPRVRTRRGGDRVRGEGFSARCGRDTPGHLAFTLGRRLAREDDIEKALAAGVAGCRDLLNAEGVAVLLLDRQRNEFFFPHVAQEEQTVAARLEQIRPIEDSRDTRCAPAGRCAATTWPPMPVSSPV